MKSVEILPATFPSKERAESWASMLDPTKAKFIEAVPSKDKPGRFQVKVERP